MELTGQFTDQGLDLFAKIASGADLEVTRIEAGSGETSASDAILASPCQQLLTGTPARNGNTFTIPATLLAAEAAEAYALTELGVYARDPDRGEILYKIYRLSDPVNITPHSCTVVRFFLNEVFSQAETLSVTCEVTEYTKKADFLPVQNNVQAVAAPSESVHLEAEELVSYITSLPRMLTKDYWLYINGGTVSEKLKLDGFYGPGRLWLRRNGDIPLVLTGGIRVRWCQTEIILDGITCQGTVADGSTGASIVYLYACPAVSIRNCAVDGTDAANAYIGITAALCSNVHIQSSTLQNLGTGLLVQTGAIAALYNVGSAANTKGIQTWAGGIVTLQGSTDNLLGGSANEKGGGIIMSANGTLL